MATKKGMYNAPMDESYNEEVAADDAPPQMEGMTVEQANEVLRRFKTGGATAEERDAALEAGGKEE